MAFGAESRARCRNVIAVATYDGMELIFRALEAAKGVTDGDVLINVMKGLQWVSPRGPVQIDPATRDIIQNIYMRKVERQGAELYNVEFQTFPAIKDPAH
jgi:branched-chain amino acid transport system substrate-binding protein